MSILPGYFSSRVTHLPFLYTIFPSSTNDESKTAVPRRGSFGPNLLLDRQRSAHPLLDRGAEIHEPALVEGPHRARRMTPLQVPHLTFPVAPHFGQLIRPLPSHVPHSPSG